MKGELAFQTAIVRAMNLQGFQAATIRDSGDSGVADVAAIYKNGSGRFVEVKLNGTEIRATQVEFLRHSWDLIPKSSWWVVGYPEKDAIVVVPGYVDIRSEPNPDVFTRYIGTFNPAYIDWAVALALI